MWSHLFNVAGPLVGVWLGWWLNERSTTKKLQREDRVRIRRVLRELLDVRHAFLLQPVGAIDTLTAVFPPDVRATLGDVPAETREKGEALFAALKPNLDELIQRYRAAADSLAEADAVLSYRLRGNELLLAVGPWMTTQVPQEERAEPAWAAAQDALADVLLPDLDDAIRDLARRLDRDERTRAEAVLERRLPTPDEMRAPMMRFLARFMYHLRARLGKEQR